jgi:hypothetical protein
MKKFKTIDIGCKLLAHMNEKTQNPKKKSTMHLWLEDLRPLILTIG